MGMGTNVATQDVISWEGIEVHVDGPSNAPVIVMVHGWPDTLRIWDRQVRALSRTFRCVRFTLPGYPVGSERRAYGLDELVGVIDGVADLVSPDAPVRLLLHDWGCIFGHAYTLAAPDRVAAVVMFDVGDANSTDLDAELTRPAKLLRSAYQGTLAAAWRRGGRLGDVVTRSVARLIAPHADPSLVHSGMNYPYAVARRQDSQVAIGEVIAHPTFFLYGTDKPLMFHSSVWINKLENTAGCEVAAVDAGHWLMVDKAEFVNVEVQRWLAWLMPKTQRA